MKGSTLYNDIGRGESISYIGFQGTIRTVSLENAIDMLAGSSYAGEEILKNSNNRERLLEVINKLKKQINEAEALILRANK